MNNDVGVLIKWINKNEFEREGKEIDMMLRRLKSRKLEVNLGSGRKSLESQTRIIRSRIQQINGLLKQLSGRGKKVEIRTELLKGERARLQAQLNKLGATMTLTPRIDLSKSFRSGKSVMGALGTSLETIGNGLTSLAYNPLSQIVTGMLRQIGVGVSGLMYEGVSSSISRFDTMRTYPKLMQKLGFSSEQSEKSIEKLNNAVLGLPTSLNEIVASSNVYASAMGDIVRGTDLAIASNNAFLASSATELQKRQGEIQIKNIIAGKKLTTKQWMSLYGAMPVALAQIGKDMGYRTTKEFQKALYSNQISNDEFIKALIGAGTGNGKLVGMAGVSKTTMSGVITNIKTAFSRMGASGLEIMDEALKMSTGKNLVQTLGDVIDAIDGVTLKVKKWVKDNPETIRKWVKEVKSFDYGGFLKSFAEGLLTGIKALVNIVKVIPANKVGFLLGGSGIFGRIITFTGQMVKGFSPVGGLINVLKTYAMFSLGRGMLGGKGFFESFAGMFRGAGKVQKAISSAPVVAPTKVAKATGNLKRLFVGLGSVLAVAGTTVAVGGSILALTKMMSAIGRTDIKWGSAVKNIAGVTAFVVALGGLALATAIIPKSALVSVEAGLLTLGILTTTIAGFMAFDTWLFKKSAKNIETIISAIDSSISMLKDIQTNASGFSWQKGVLDEMRDAMEEVASLSTKNGGGKYSWFDKKASENMNTIASNFSSTVSSFVTITDSLKNVKAPNKSSVTAVAKVMEFSADFYDKLFVNPTFDLSVFDDGNIGTKETENVATIMSNFQSAIEQIKVVTDTIVAMQGNLNKLNKIPSLTNKFSTVLSSISDFYNKIWNDKTIKAGWYDQGKVGAKQTENVDQILSNFATSIGNIKTILETYSSINGKLNALTSKGSGDKSPLERLSSELSTIISHMGDIYSELNKAFGTGKMTSADIEGISDKIDLLRKAINNIKSIATLLNSMQSSIGTLLTPSAGRSGLGGTASGVSGTPIFGIVTQIRGIITAMAYMSQTIQESNISSVDKKMGSIKKALNSVKSVLSALVSVKGQFASLGDGGKSTIANIKSLIQQFNTLNGDEKNLVVLSMQLTAFSNALTNLATSLETFVGKGNSGLVGVVNALKRIATECDITKTKLTAFLTGMTAKWRNAGTQWRTALLQGLGLEGLQFQITSALSAILSSRNFYQNGFNTGNSFANGLKSAIMAFQLNPTVPTGIGARITAGMHSKGGVIYRAGGGMVGFVPRGTDRIPAMLTKGEFVQRRSAVNHFGTAFMERINNLDLGGALRSLSYRASNLVSPRGTTVINNNTNNAKLTQHIHTNNDGFAYKRADRYVRSL